MNEFLRRAEAEIDSRHLLPRGQKILVAVSGGADSLVLLHVLHLLTPKNRWKISVAHFNHKLRGRASAADETLVRRTAKKLSLPYHAGPGDVKQFAAQSKISVEMAARKLRHGFLARVAGEQKISVIALAHHADDQVELFFLRLLRGAGGEGLAGMKWRSPSPADKTIALVRPLLGFSKAEILEFAHANKIRFRDDATNFSSDFLRNRIRNELLPLLQKKYQPGLTKTVLRQMEITGAEAEFTGATAVAWLAKPEMAFEKLPVAVQRQVLQRQLTGLGVVSDFELVERLRAAPGKFVSIGSDFSVARGADGKVQLKKSSGHFDEKFQADEIKFKFNGRAGRTVFGGWEFCWDLKEFAGVRGRSPHQTEFFAADTVGREIVLRHWRAGDRFQPIGLPSAVKVQDLFVNAKISAGRRRALVLAATAGGEIFWVEGLRMGEKFKLTAAAKRVLTWHWSKFAA